MKPEFPALYAKASSNIAGPIIVITTILYIIQAINKTASDIYPLALTTFGITATLSGICFRMSSSTSDEPNIRYSAEKFLHSSVLLIESLIVIYARDTLVKVEFINNNNLIKSLILGIFGAVIICASTAAGWAWYWGYSELNNRLWKRWENRIAEINKDTGNNKDSSQSDK